jgi:AcrR family transcriptional regulator
MPAKNDLRRDHGDRTRQSLLRAARTLIAERGTAGVRLRDVSEAAGANVAAISYHFGSLSNLLDAAVRDAADAAIGEQARLLSDLPPDAGLAEVVTAWIKPTVHGLQEAPEELTLLRIASRAIADVPENMGEWVQDALERTHGLLVARLQPVLGCLDEKELAFRVFCVGGIVQRFITAPSLPEGAAVSSPEFERLLVAAITGLLSGPGSPSTGAPIAASRARTRQRRANRTRPLPDTN